jgi:hypothetical protein
MTGGPCGRDDCTGLDIGEGGTSDTRGGRMLSAALDGGAGSTGAATTGRAGAGAGSTAAGSAFLANERHSFSTMSRVPREKVK